jgi:hypothetical protein
MMSEYISPTVSNLDRLKNTVDGLKNMFFNDRR